MKSNKKYLALFITISLLLTACDDMGASKQDNSLQPTEPIKLSEIMVSIPQGEAGAENKLEAGELQATMESLQDAENELQATGDVDTPVYEVSRKEATVKYEGDNFIKRVFAVGGDMIYVVGKAADGSDFLGNMKAEDKEFTYFTVEMPENMQVLNMTVDAQGNCHMLWVSAERQVLDGVEHNILNYEKCCITKVSKEGELEAVMDISRLFAEEQTRPYCFITDQDGCYYFDGNEKIMKLYPDGSIAACIACDGWIEAIGCAKNGEIYCIYRTENGEELIGWVEEEKVTDCGVMMPEVDASYSNMVAGTDTELLLFNREGGAYTYNAATNTVETRVAGYELPVAGQDIAGCGFLGDGRLCLMSHKEDTVTFYYIPVGE